MRHLIDPLDFTKEETQKLLDLADRIHDDPEAYQDVADHKRLATLFYEPSTRTRLSFESAMLRLGGKVLGFPDVYKRQMHDYKEKEFKNINSGDLGLETEDEKKAAEETATENKDLFEEIKKALNGKIKDVKVKPTLQDHQVSLSSEGGISMEMEKILRKMPAGGEGMESTKVLELNPNHAVFGALKAAHEAGDTDKINKMCIRDRLMVDLTAFYPAAAKAPGCWR